MKARVLHGEGVTEFGRGWADILTSGRSAMVADNEAPWLGRRIALEMLWERIRKALATSTPGVG